MNKFLRLFVPLAVGASLIIIFLLAIWPVSLSRENSVEVNALVTGVSKNGRQGIVINLDGQKGIHFIDRGIERGYLVEDLSKKLMDKHVTVWYAKPRILSGLSPMPNVIQITELKLGKEIVFSEFR